MKDTIIDYLSKISVYNDEIFDMASELDRYPQLSKIIFDLCDNEEIINAEYKTISYADTEISHESKEYFVFSISYRPKLKFPVSRDYDCEEADVFINKPVLYQRLKNISKWIEKEDR